MSFRIFAEQLSYLGISADDIRQMVVANPRRFLGLPESPGQRKTPL